METNSGKYLIIKNNLQKQILHLIKRYIHILMNEYVLWLWDEWGDDTPKNVTLNYDFSIKPTVEFLTSPTRTTYSNVFTYHAC